MLLCCGGRVAEGRVDKFHVVRIGMCQNCVGLNMHTVLVGGVDQRLQVGISLSRPISPQSTDSGVVLCAPTKGCRYSVSGYGTCVG